MCKLQTFGMSTKTNGGMLSVYYDIESNMCSISVHQ